MNRQDVIAVLQQNADALRARGVTHAALFGSLARGEARPDSDIDIMIELDPNLPIDIFQYAGIKMAIEELFSVPVDVVDRQAMKPRVRDNALPDAIEAF